MSASLCVAEDAEVSRETGALTSTQALALVVAVRDATSVDSQLEAEGALARLSFTSSNVSMLMDAGAVPVLATALREWKYVSARFGCVEAIARMSLSDNEASAFSEAGVLQPLVDLLPVYKTGGSSTSAWALFALTTDNSEVLQQLRDVPGVMEALEGLKRDTGDFATKLLDRLRPLRPRNGQTSPHTP